MPRVRVRGGDREVREDDCLTVQPRPSPCGHRETRDTELCSGNPKAMDAADIRLTDAARPFRVPLGIDTIDPERPGSHTPRPFALCTCTRPNTTLSHRH